MINFFPWRGKNCESIIKDFDESKDSSKPIHEEKTDTFDALNTFA